MRPTIAVLALAAAAAWFACGGPLRGFGRATDFAVVYAGARVWLERGNPYDPQALDRAWHDAGGDPGFRPGGRTAVYPPSIFPALAPFACLPWRFARGAWLALCAGGYLLMAAVAARHAGANGMWFWAAALAFAPAHTLISLGQPSAVAFGLIALAIRPATWSAGSGWALGLACALKPQLGGVFVLHALLRRRGACVFRATATAVGLLTIGAAWLEQGNQVPWRESLRRNLTTLAEREGGVGAGNPLRHDVLHLAAPLHALGIPERWAGPLAAVAVGVVCLVWFAGRRPPTDHDGWALAALAALLVLPVYHRIYDASVYVFVLAWAMAARRWLPLALLAPFLAPGAAWLHDPATPATPGSLFWRFLTIYPAWLAAALPVAIGSARSSGNRPTANGQSRAPERPETGRRLLGEDQRID